MYILIVFQPQLFINSFNYADSNLVVKRIQLLELLFYSFLNYVSNPTKITLKIKSSHTPIPAKFSSTNTIDKDLPLLALSIRMVLHQSYQSGSYPANTLVRFLLCQTCISTEISPSLPTLM